MRQEEEEEEGSREWGVEPCLDILFYALGRPRRREGHPPPEVRKRRTSRIPAVIK